MAEQAKWYVAHTYSGYENKVKANIEKAIENRNMQDIILDIRVPMEEVVEMKDDVPRKVMRKTFPGYIIVKMIMTSESWYVIRNTRGVTGFVGPESKPVPLTEEEIAKIGLESDKKVVLSFNVGDTFRIKYGALEGSVGVIISIDTEKQRVKAKVAMFGRDTDVELEYNQIEALS